MKSPVASRRSAVVIPAHLSWVRQMAAAVAALGLWLCIKSWRRKWISARAIFETVGPVIYCVWHNRLVLAVASYKDLALEQWHEKGLATVVSASGDGAFLAAVLQKFGVQAIRGSSSRRGPQALLEATRWIRKDYSVAITPDGPRGPVYEVQDGIIFLAQLTGRPIIPVSNVANWKLRLRSWDRFQIPLPFATCKLLCGEPIWVPRDASETDREQLRLKLAESMRAISVE
jgi:lysophospholipid acyltransferase (LPLAT)-like uncharacterized protein